MAASVTTATGSTTLLIKIRLEMMTSSMHKSAMRKMAPTVSITWRSAARREVTSRMTPTTRPLAVSGRDTFRAAMARAAYGAAPNAGYNTAGGVRVTQIVEDETPLKLVYDPTHPDANEDGYVEMPNVDMVKEITDAMAATQAYSANVTAFNTLKTVVAQGLEIGR